MRSRTNRITMLLCLLGVVLLFAGRTRLHAQDAETRKHLMHELSGPFIVYRGSVQTDLKLTAEQKQKLLDAQPEYAQAMIKQMEKVQQTPAEQREPDMQAFRAKSAEKFWAILKTILTPEQFTRFHQLELQHEGPGAIFRPEISRELKITQDQRQQFMTIIQDLQKTIAPMIQQAQSGGNPEEIRPKVIKIIAAHEAEIETKLDPSQKKRWQEMRGRLVDTLSDG